MLAAGRIIVPDVPLLRIVMTLAVAGLVLVPAAASAKVRTETLRAGPYALGGYRTQFLKESVPRPRASGYVTRMRASLVDARGRPVTIRDGMLHHVYFNNLSVLRTAGQCTSRQPEVFYGTGEENESLDLPPGYGYRLRRHDRWQMSGMLMSHRYRPKRVYVRYVVTTDTARRTAVRPLWVRANGCGSSSAYHVRGDGGPGSVDDRVDHWKVPIGGRIVASGGHLHAGAINLVMRQPSCGDRVLFDNAPSFAPADDLLYHVVPRLHEAGPIQTSWFTSKTGIPVAKGEVLDLHGLYANDHPRQSVMAITHVYIAPESQPPVGCSPLPADAHQTAPKAGERPSAPYQSIPLYTLDARHRPVVIDEPPGPSVPLADNALIDLRSFAFTPEKVTIAAGSTLQWRFDDLAAHNLTFASGPRAVAGQQLAKGGRTSTRFDTPGRYQLFCYLHPMTMHEQITVTP